MTGGFWAVFLDAGGRSYWHGGARRRTNQDLDRAIAASSHEPLFIKNLENVQGDERDVIFFSITYGTDAAGKMSMNLGPLNGEGGHRRLNVAISRAREGVVIFSTLMPEQIDLAKVRAAGVRDLKHYLEFALRGPRALAEQSMPTGLEPDSPFETAVLKVLRDKGWSVHPQVGCSGYRIDMAVVDPRAPGKYLAGIECDGRWYHSGATARDRDRLRQHVLESLGWRIHRIWSTDWWLNAEGETEKLLALLHTMLVNESIEHDAPTQDIQEEASEATDVESNNDADQSSTDPSPVSEVSDHLFAPATVPAGDPIAFYEGRSNRELAENIRQVAQTEGPVLEAVLFRRVARAWGLERTGSKIVERLRMLIPRSVVSTHEASRIFYWPGGSIPGSWHTYRIASPDDEASRRHVDEVCLEELAALVIHVLEQAGASPRGDIARSVCRLIGMARTPVDAEARVTEAVERLLKVGAVKDVNGYVQRA